MKDCVTLNEDDIAEAVDLLLAQRGQRCVGRPAVNYSAPDRPTDSGSYSVSVEAEALPPGTPPTGAPTIVVRRRGPSNYTAEVAGQKWWGTGSSLDAAVGSVVQTAHYVAVTFDQSTDPSTPAAPARGATAPASRRARAPRSA